MGNAIFQKVRIHCGFSLGDAVVLTGAVRALHESYPGVYKTEVISAFPELWENNPYNTPVRGKATIIDCDEIQVDSRGERGQHYLGAFIDLFNRSLQLDIPLRHVSGEIYLSEEERSWYSEIYNFCKRDLPYWVICCGGKLDIPIKWWSADRYQQIVDHFRGRIQFVQVGTWGNYHPKLQGTIDLRGQTSVRDLIHLVFCADGVLCGVTSLMHLAAAVPIERGRTRSAIIIGGAREPEVWERYPDQIYLGSNDQFGCHCCWRGDHRFSPVDDGQKSGSCENVSNRLPACMDAISPAQVIAHIENLIAKQQSRLLHPSDVPASIHAVKRAEANSTFDRDNLTLLNAVTQAEAFIERIGPFPQAKFSGRGIIILGGGLSYFTNAWVCIRMLRMLGCKLPIELWHLGSDEVDSTMETLVSPFGVACINAQSMFRKYPMRNPLGWELKSYALVHSRFAELLFLDADNVPVTNPEFLFDDPHYKEHGAVFWPDYGRLGARRQIWKLAGIKYRNEPEFETGQMVIDKKRCWKALNLAFWYNDHSEFFYKYVHGDKETFHLAWRKLDQTYAMPPYPIRRLPGTMCQHDFQGRVLFQHRNGRKWRLFRENESVEGFIWEKECLGFLSELRNKWNGEINGQTPTYERNGVIFRTETWDEGIFHSINTADEYRLPASFENNDVVIDIGAHIGSFSIAAHRRGSRNIHAFEPCRANYEIAERNLSRLTGVTLLQNAVLDRPMKAALIFPDPVDKHRNTGSGCLEFSTARQAESESCESISLDDLLRRLQRVKLLKLDCEGAEWPILLNSKELWRVERICGEYHEQPSHPLCSIAPLNRTALRQILGQTFRCVRTKRSPDPRLGWFWASQG